MKKIAVITANFGGIDSQKYIPEQSIIFDQYYYTEKNSPYDFSGLDNRLKAKYFKWQMHKIPDLEKKYDIFVWVDANILIKRPDVIERLVKGIDLFDISITSHPDRDCIYKEAEFIMNGIKNGNIYLKARYNNSIQNEVDFFRKMGHPENAGLCWCGLFAVENSDKMNDCFDAIWNDNILRSNFDQNSFMFNALQRKVGINYTYWGNFHKNDNYELIHHSKLM